MLMYNPENLVFGKNDICHPDYFRMFVHLIVTMSSGSLKRYDFMPISMITLRKRVHDKKSEVIRAKLIEDGIIECDGIFCPQIKSFGYKLAKKYRTRLKTIKATNNYVLKKYPYKEPELLLPQHKIIWHWLNKIEIDYKLAKKLLPGSRFLTQKSLMLEKLKEKDFFFVIDKQGRVHTNISNLWSKFRAYLSINNQKLVNVDIKNSQPLIFSNFLKKEIYNYICIYNRTDEPLFEDVTLFIDLVKNGIFYDYLMEEFDFEDRNKFKKMFFAEIFYSILGFESEFSRRFDKLFPNVSNIIKHYKRIDHRDLPLEMQRIEAKLMINGVCGKLAELSHIPFLTVHDSILTTPEHVDQVKTIIKEVFTTEDLSPTFG